MPLRNFFYITIFIIVLCLSCSSPQKEQGNTELTLEELLTKTWELHQVAGKNTKNGITSSEIYHDKYVEFKNNTTYTTNATKYFKKEEGTWKLNPTRDSIYINKDTKDQIVFSIFNIYEKGISLMSYETETEEDWQGQFYTLQFVEVGYYGTTQIPKEKR